MTTLPEEAVKAAQKAYRECEGDSTESHRAALTAALPFLPVQGAVKKLKWNEYNDEQGIPDRWDAEASSFGVFYSIEIQHDGYRVVFDHEAVGAVGVFDTLETAKAAAQADYSARILSALEPSAARELALEEAARVCDAKIVSMQAHYDQTDNPFIRSNLAGDIALISHLAAAIRALSSPDHADAVRERAWYFSAGDTVPEWLEKIEKGNCTMTFGVDVVVTSKDGGYEVRPQGIADNAGPILHVVNQGNVTPEIKGGGNGVAIIGYNRPYDETAEGKIERLKRLLEMARPYVECYDTREHNAEQDAVLTEIDKALSVVVGEPHPDAGKLVEGDGIERAKFYHHQWPMERLLAARRDGLVDHSGGEAWRYEYSHKDEHGKYDILYRPVKNSTIPARLPSAPSEGAE